MKLFKKKPQPYYETILVENQKEIRNFVIDEIGRKIYFTFTYGYEDGFLKLCCYGGTAFKIKCKQEDVEDLINPIIKLNFDEERVIKYCKDWQIWNYYQEFHSRKLIIP